MDCFFEKSFLEALESAWAYYESKDPGLGDRFEKAVYEQVQHVKSHPLAAPKIGRYSRKRLVQGFPYGVVYQIRSGAIYFLAIAHAKQRPLYWEEG